ncbi:activating molecule in BECN1-regulated autophagy protein 1B-like [Eriocheir sinensis]|uniref:activating molecule in BECN1-regulated autophagy protein 1B-like n=1 Tax=Eriocheir sinensis TaxID=95602 RepID=UPI0021C5F82B|nr:activating molecule in BECN1-regulated autophagy protein 1B-like [Eriocheir sinensis]
MESVLIHGRLEEFCVQAQTVSLLTVQEADRDRQGRSLEAAEHGEEMSPDRKRAGWPVLPRTLWMTVTSQRVGEDSQAVALQAEPQHASAQPENPMDDMFLEGKMEVGEEVRRQCHDPMLAPTPVLLARREVPARHPRATTTQLHHISEEMLVYRKHNLLSCQLPGSPKSTFLMVFSPDGSKVASTHGDHNIYVSEVNTGQCICTLEGHPRTPWCVAFHPASNEIVASGCLGGEVRVWGLKGGSEVWTTEKSTVIASLAFHPTDKVLVIATYNEIYFWDWFQPQPFTKICTADEKEKVRYVKFDPLGHKLITGSPTCPTRGRVALHPPHALALELVEREQRYSQLSSQYLSLVSHLRP